MVDRIQECEDSRNSNPQYLPRHVNHDLLRDRPGYVLRSLCLHQETDNILQQGKRFLFNRTVLQVHVSDDLEII